MKNIGFIGLGLIGGSLAKATRLNTSYVIYGSDNDGRVMDSAINENIVDFKLDEENANSLDFLIVTLYPSDVVDVILGIAPFLKQGCIVVDSTGVKSSVCKLLSKELNEKGIHFIGGHPMAGKEVSGYVNSEAGLFSKASMILCRDEYTDDSALEESERFYKEIGFAGVVITTPKEHDEIIAYTSQMAHVVSSAYIKSPTLGKRQGFSAGSYKDMTRVARLNENVWADLFLANDEALLSEIDTFMNNMQEYRNAIAGRDRSELVKLLAEGRELKVADDNKESTI